MLTEDDTTIKDKVHNGKCGISYTSMGQLNNWNKEEEAAVKRRHMGLVFHTRQQMMVSISSVFGDLELVSILPLSQRQQTRYNEALLTDA